MGNEFKQLKRQIIRDIVMGNCDNSKVIKNVESIAESMIKFNAMTAYRLGILGIMINEIKSDEDNKTITYFLTLPNDYIDIKNENGEIYTIQSAAKEAKEIVSQYSKEYFKSISKYTENDDEDLEIKIGYTRRDDNFSEKEREETIVNLKKEILEKYGVNL